MDYVMQLIELKPNDVEGALKIVRNMLEEDGEIRPDIMHTLCKSQQDPTELLDRTDQLVQEWKDEKAR